MLLALLTQLAVACDPADLVRALEQGEEAFDQNDSHTSRTALRDAKKALSCTTPTAEQLARLHRLDAYSAGFEKDWVTAEESWRASLAAHPLLPVDTHLWDHPRLHLAWVRAQETGVRYSVSNTRQPIAGLNTPLVPDTKPLRSSPRARKQALRFTGIGLGLAAVGLYGGAWASRSEYNQLTQQEKPVAERRTAYTVTNALSLGSVGVGALGASLFVVSFAK